MEFGNVQTWIAIMSIVAAVIIGIAIANYTGVLSFLGTVGGYLGQFFSFLGRFVSMAPKPVKIGIFILFGIPLLGLVANWILAVNYVCVQEEGGQTQLYESSSFVTALVAKMLPGGEPPDFDTDADVEVPLEGRKPPIEEQPVPLLEASKSSFNKVAELATVVSGTFMNTGAELQKAMIYGTEANVYGGGKLESDVVYMAVPADFFVEQTLAERLLREPLPEVINPSFEVTDIFPTQGKSFSGDSVEFAICEVQNVCFATKERYCGSFFSGVSYIGSFQYQLHSYEDENNVLQSRLVVVYDGPETLLSTLRANPPDLNACPHQGFAGEVFLEMPDQYVTQSFLSGDTGRYVNLDEETFGFVGSVVYVPVTSTGVGEVHGPQTRKLSFIENSDSFVRVPSVDGEFVCPRAEDRGEDSCMLRYACSAEDENVRVLVWGVDVFSVQIMVLLLFIIGFITFLRWIGIL